MNERYLSPEYHPHREAIRQLMRPRPTVVAIEGGPCSGKTTLMEQLSQARVDRNIVFLPEAATVHIAELQARGVDIASLPETNRSEWLNLERKILGSIVANIEQAQAMYAGTDTIIVTDRCDIGAYVTQHEYNSLLADLEFDKPPMLSHVDQLYYLPSLARIDSQHYEAVRSDNPARTEHADRAVQLCARTLSSVARHPELHVAWGGDFRVTLSEVADSIVAPDTESELKIVPDDIYSAQSFINSSTEISRSAISQTYHDMDGVRFRLRRTLTEHGEQIFSFTVKSGRGVRRDELQRTIDEHTFTLLSDCPQVGGVVEKQRQILLRSDGDTKQRAWAVDEHVDKRLPRWTLETDVRSEVEVCDLIAQMPRFSAALETAEVYASRLAGDALGSMLS